MLPSEFIITSKISVDKTLKYEYFMDKNHPLANSSGKVYMHRHVASVKLGKWIYNEHVHHIDGNRCNNDQCNLIVMSNSEHYITHHPLSRNPNKECEFCKKTFFAYKEKIRFCSNKCSCESRIKINLSKEELENIISTTPMCHICKIYGVSDKTIAKLCDKYGILRPERGFWNKKYSRSSTG